MIGLGLRVLLIDIEPDDMGCIIYTAALRALFVAPYLYQKTGMAVNMTYRRERRVFKAQSDATGANSYHTEVLRIHLHDQDTDCI